MAVIALPNAIVGTIKSYRKLCTVTLDGDLDLSTRQHTRAQLQPLAHYRYGIVDLRNARIADATFFGDLAAAYRAYAGKGGAIVLISSNERLRRLFRMVQFDKVFPIVASLAEARRLISWRKAAAK